MFTWDQFSDFISVMNKQLIYEGTSDDHVNYTVRRIADLKTKLAETSRSDKGTIAEIERLIRKSEERLKRIVIGF